MMQSPTKTKLTIAERRHYSSLSNNKKRKRTIKKQLTVSCNNPPPHFRPNSSHETDQSRAITWTQPMPNCVLFRSPETGAIVYCLPNEPVFRECHPKGLAGGHIFRSGA